MVSLFGPQCLRFLHDYPFEADGKQRPDPNLGVHEDFSFLDKLGVLDRWHLEELAVFRGQSQETPRRGWATIRTARLLIERGGSLSSSHFGVHVYDRVAFSLQYRARMGTQK